MPADTFASDNRRYVNLGGYGDTTKPVPTSAKVIGAGCTHPAHSIAHLAREWEVVVLALVQPRRGIGFVYYETGQTAQKKRQKKFSLKMDRTWRLVHMYNLFTNSEELLLHRLSDYLSYENAIAHKGERLSSMQMADLLYMDRGQFSRTLKKLIRKNAIGVWVSGDKMTYYMNPELYLKGSQKPELMQKFQHEVTTAKREGATVFNIRYASKTLLVGR